MIFHHSRGQLRNMVESYNGTFKSGDAVQIKDGIVHAGSTQQVTCLAFSCVVSQDGQCRKAHDHLEVFIF